MKCTIGLAHVPLSDLDDAMKILKDFEFEDEKCTEFQNYMCTYLEEFWINGPFPPQV